MEVSREFFSTNEKRPEEKQVVEIQLLQGTVYGIRKYNFYFFFKPIISQPCNCVTGYELKEIDNKGQLFWRPLIEEIRERMQIIYQDYI